MKAKVGLLVISVLAVAVSISPLAFAQGGPYGRTRVSAASASTKEQGNSAEAARESAADATSKVKEGNDYRKARAELNDSRLTAKAKAALGKDEQTRSSAIQIATANGIMVLSGPVDSKAVAERAQAIVVRLKGVKDVHNELTYRASGGERVTPAEHESPMTRVPVSTKEQGDSGAEAARESAADATSKVKEGNDYRKARAELKDSILTAKAKAALDKDEQTRNSAIQIATANGIVVLSGRVDSKAAADRAQTIVVHLKGVKDVHNELTYRASSDDKATLPSANRR
jgi:hyperosmotically inducible protein